MLTKLLLCTISYPLIKGRSWITCNSIDKSWINTIKHPVPAVPSIARNAIVLDASWKKPKTFSIYEPNISVFVHTIHEIGRWLWRDIRWFWWYGSRWRRGWCLCWINHYVHSFCLYPALYSEMQKWTRQR